MTTKFKERILFALKYKKIKKGKPREEIGDDYSSSLENDDLVGPTGDIIRKCPMQIQFP
jgi:hypothetical protein